MSQLKESGNQGVSLLNAGPFVDREESFTHSKTSEKTATGQKESGSAAKTSQVVEQSVVRGPASTSTRKVQQKTSQEMSESCETSRRSSATGDVGKHLTPVDDFTKEFHTPTTMTVAVSDPLIAPVTDKQETFTHSKTSEKTATGHKESQTAEKKSQTMQETVSRTPTGGTATKKVQQKVFQTMTEECETSKRKSKPAPPVSVDQVPAIETSPFVTSPQPGSPFEDKQNVVTLSKTSEKTEKGHKDSEVLETTTEVVEQGPASGPRVTKTRRTQRTFIEEEVETSKKPKKKSQPSPEKISHISPVPAVSSLAPNLENQLAPVEPLPVPEIKPGDKLHGNRKQNLRYTQSSEKTSTGEKGSESTEKRTQEVQNIVTKTPTGGTAKKTVQKKTFQTVSESYETSSTKKGAPKLVSTEQPQLEAAPVSQSQPAAATKTQQSWDETLDKVERAQGRPTPVETQPGSTGVSARNLTEKSRTTSETSEKTSQHSSVFDDDAPIEMPPAVVKVMPGSTQPYHDVQKRTSQESSDRKTDTGHQHKDVKTDMTYEVKHDVSKMPTSTGVPLLTSHTSSRRTSVMEEETKEVSNKRRSSYPTSSTLEQIQHPVHASPTHARPESQRPPSSEVAGPEVNKTFKEAFEQWPGTTTVPVYETVTQSLTPDERVTPGQHSAATMSESKKSNESFTQHQENVVPMETPPLHHRQDLTEETYTDQLGSFTSSLDRRPRQSSNTPRSSAQEHVMTSVTSQLDRGSSHSGNERLIPVQKTPSYDQQHGHDSHSVQLDRTLTDTAHASHLNGSGSYQKYSETERRVENVSSGASNIPVYTSPKDSGLFTSGQTGSLNQSTKTSTMTTTEGSGSHDGTRYHDDHVVPVYLSDDVTRGKNEYCWSPGYTSGSELEHDENSLKRKKEKLALQKGADTKVEVFETEETRPEGRYHVKKTVETTTALGGGSLL